MLVFGDRAPLTVGRAGGVVGVPLVPALWHVQSPIQRRRSRIGGGVHADRDLTVADLAQVPEYWRVTHGEASPSLTNPVSSITHASGSIRARALRESVLRTGSTSHGELVTICCNRWLSTRSRCAIGCIDLRRPSSIKPRT